MPIWPSLPRALQALGVDPNSPLGRFNRRVKRTGRAIEELPELPEEALDWAIRAPDEELEVGPSASLAIPSFPDIPTTGIATTPYGTDIGVPNRPSRIAWNWSDTGTNEPRPEEGQKWLQRAGAGTQFPLPLSDVELSQQAYQFPNVGNVQEDWKLRQSENLAASNRAQQALSALSEAETETSPLVSSLRQRQAEQKALPQAAYATGLMGQARISGELARDRAEIEAEQDFKEMTVEALSKGPEAAGALLRELYPAWAEMGEFTTLDEEGERIRTQLEKAIQLLLPKALEGLNRAGGF